MEQMMEHMFHRWSRGWPWKFGEAEALGWDSAIDVVDRTDELVLRADQPGMTDKDGELSMQDGYRTIWGARKEEKQEKDGNYYRCERSYGSSSRPLGVPSRVNVEQITATLQERGTGGSSSENQGSRREKDPDQVILE